MAGGVRKVHERGRHPDELVVIPRASEQLDVDSLPVIVVADGKDDRGNPSAALGVSRRPKLARLPPPSFRTDEVASAVGEGSITVSFVHQSLRPEKGDSHRDSHVFGNSRRAFQARKMRGRFSTTLLSL